ncbi:GntR family transcriptional regulator [Pseudoduganella ginsengisoli]|uniref:FCD domain-containing protein n=1 Tax=Pseudoduganella ginsengisoli TaxID=1462440 RepID=A0A6L6Q7S1_9BURK|nr:GntR family transcriptional regulator [Pseudoduganella ginsengisoli]MTW05321.1 FCD domain-containing protein [Pseudoduganella ginsengisoli]
MALVVQTLSEQIFTLVRDRIIAGHIPPDTPIRQDALAAELGVSKIPLREALARLEQECLLVSHANRGFFVRPLSAEEAEEVYALRLQLEPDAVSAACKVATQDDKAAAKLALKALDKAMVGNKELVGSLNRAFHMSLVQPLGRPLTIQIIERLNIMSERYVRKHLEPAGRDDRAHKEHLAMLELWSEGKAKAVASMMHDHIASTLEDLRREFRN